MKTTSLKPCPFCGKEARMRYLGDKLRGDKYMIQCTDTSCPGRIFRTYPSEHAAVNAWNGRVTDKAAQPKWISVEDELPKRWRENDKEQTLINYQIYSPEYGVDVGNYLKPAGAWVIMGLPVKVTHWMPLPEPPRGMTDAQE